ncbi:MAG: hypothetical protein J6Y29_02195 [Clostridiales bacterium]|nr:hypothetical protein [Clostridiales bacterium]
MDNKELLEKLKELTEKMVDKMSKNLDELEGQMTEAIKEPCKIHIDNNGTNTQLDVSGTRLNLLLTLAGAEKTILRDLHCSDSEFEFIKNFVRAGEDKDNE